MSAGDIQLSPAERRLLRRVFHRYAAPYLAGLGLLAIWAIAADDEAPQMPPPLPAAAARPADLEALRDRLEQALADLARVRAEEREAAEATVRQLAALEERLGGAARRIEDLEKTAADAQKSRARRGAAPPADAASWDVSGILERLYNLELRQEQAAANGGAAAFAASEKRILARLAELETRAARLEGELAARDAGDTLPAAPTP